VIELIIMVCAIKEPDYCKDVHLRYASKTGTVRECMSWSFTEIAKWNTQNPNWVVKKWHCAKPEQRKSTI